GRDPSRDEARWGSGRLCRSPTTVNTIRSMVMVAVPCLRPGRWEGEDRAASIIDCSAVDYRNEHRSAAGSRPTAVSALPLIGLANPGTTVMRSLALRPAP